MTWYRRTIFVFSAVFVLIGLSLLVVTALNGGGVVGFVLVGFATGWVLLLDFLIVIALSSLFLPHYLAAAFAAPSLRHSPWDVVIAVAAISVIVGVRLVRHSRIHRTALVLALLDLAVQLL